MSISVRQAGPDDIEKILPLFADYRVFYGKQPDAVAERTFIAERVIREESVIYLAESQEGEAKGFAQLYPLFSSTRLGRLWLLNDLFVVAASRGSGVGTLLIEQAQQLARDTDAVGLLIETQKDNDAANKVYPACGFVLNSSANYYEWENADRVPVL